MLNRNMSDLEPEAATPETSSDAAETAHSAEATLHVMFQPHAGFQPGDDQPLATKLATPKSRERVTHYQYSKLLTEHWFGLETSMFYGIQTLAQQFSDWGKVIENAIQGKHRVEKAEHATVVFNPAIRNRILDDYPELASGFNSLHMARMIQWRDNDAPGHASKTYNNGLYTHNEDGSLNHIRSADLLPYFAKGTNPQDWPQLLLTSSHARCDNSKDITDIMDNIHSMLSHIKGKTFDLIRDPWRTQPAKGKAILVSAVHTQPTSEGNAAAMLMRFNFRKDHPSLDERVNPEHSPEYRGVLGKLEKTTDPEKRKRLEADIEMLAPSPAATRLSKLMLKLMVENPDSVDVDRSETLDELRACRELPEAPILRSDAAEIAKHLSLQGYSLAANTVNDAMRHFVHELRATHEMHGMSREQATRETGRIAHHIVLTCLNGPAVPVTKEEYDLGIRRTLINSRNDLISYHFLITAWGNVQKLLGFSDEETRVGKKLETKCLINGTHIHLGHDNDNAMGKGATRGYFLTEPSSYKALNDQYASRVNTRQVA